MQEISQLDNTEEVIKLLNSWEERGVRKEIEQGIVKGKEAVIIKMLAEGLSVELIAKVTEAEKDEIEKLREMN
ncbi:hypothetical protein [Sporosarcina sp. HYO08]|uniref:hypothetical protein n=1 Tax=Sporosarcina sp. HYO08 TaxID=1759557 RepID=UPI000791DD86|nr:hypothetical protein [Sporosarcina sp. HYO08]KXH81855.1 hypothetical protein AU377_06215 [Sporosarcina sp. HYO08]